MANFGEGNWHMPILEVKIKRRWILNEYTPRIFLNPLKNFMILFPTRVTWVVISTFSIIIKKIANPGQYKKGSSHYEIHEVSCLRWNTLFVNLFQSPRKLQRGKLRPVYFDMTCLLKKIQKKVLMNNSSVSQYLQQYLLVDFLCFNMIWWKWDVSQRDLMFYCWVMISSSLIFYIITNFVSNFFMTP